MNANMTIEEFRTKCRDYATEKIKELCEIAGFEFTYDGCAKLIEDFVEHHEHKYHLMQEYIEIAKSEEHNEENTMNAHYIEAVESIKHRYIYEREAKTPYEKSALIHKYWRELHSIKYRCDEFWSFREMLARDMLKNDYYDCFNQTTDNDLLAAVLALDGNYDSEEQALEWILHCERTEPRMKQPTEYTQVNFEVATSVATDTREMKDVAEHLYEEIIKLRGKQSMIANHGNYNNEHIMYFDGAIYGMEKAFEILVGCSIGQYVYENEWRV